LRRSEWEEKMDTSLTGDKIQLAITSYEDVIVARQKVREMMNAMGFSLLEQTRMITAGSELAHNIVVHAKRGHMTAERIEKNMQPGIRCVFQDQGPGIKDLATAIRQGTSASNALGLGLNGVKKLIRDFQIESVVGRGTSVSITQLKKEPS
jgi:serine/threonine-protein kinase RsbT